MINTEIDKLAKEYFVDELGLASDEVAEASQNLLGYFRTLYAIQERLNRKAAV
jgi:hypothetical protein